jgi:hypothetical protein
MDFAKYLNELKEILNQHAEARKKGRELSDAAKAKDQGFIERAQLKYADQMDRDLTADSIAATGHIRTVDGDLLDTATTGRDMYVMIHNDDSTKQTTHSFQENPDIGDAREHHSSAPAGGKAVGAGRRRVEKGIYRHIDADSGHYKPRLEDIFMFVAQEKARGAKMIDDESLMMTGPDGESVPADPGARGLWAEFMKLETAYQEQRQKQMEEIAAGKPGEELKLTPRDKDHEALKQRVEDLGLAPSMSDATVEAIKSSTFFSSAEEFAECQADQSAMQDKFLKSFGSELYPKLQNGTKNTKYSYPFPTKDYALVFMNMTLEKANEQIGLMLRLRYDVDEFIDGGNKWVKGEQVDAASGNQEPAKSNARVQMTEAQFVQTGGEQKAIEGKEAVNAAILQAKKRPTSESDETEVYEELRYGKDNEGNYLKGDAALESLLMTLKKAGKVPKKLELTELTTHERFVVLSKKRVPPDLLAKLGKEKAYRNMGGDAALEKLLLSLAEQKKIPESLDATEWPVEKRYDVLAGGRVPTRLWTLGGQKLWSKEGKKKLKEAYHKAGGDKALEKVVADLEEKKQWPNWLKVENITKPRLRYALLIEKSMSPELLRVSSKQRRDAYKGLGGDPALNDLLANLEEEDKVPPGFDAKALKLQEKYRILTRKYVSAELMEKGVEEDFLKKHYEKKLGGDKALKEKLGVQEPDVFSVAEKHTFLTQGYIPAKHMKAAWGIGLAVEKLGGDAKLKELGAATGAALSDKEKFQILCANRVPPELLEKAFGGAAGIEAKLKTLLQAIKLDPSLSDHVPKEKRLAIIRKKHFPDRVMADLKHRQKIITHGGLAGLRAKAVEKIKAWLNTEGLAEDLTDHLAKMMTDEDEQLALVDENKLPEYVKREAHVQARITQAGGLDAVTNQARIILTNAQIDPYWIDGLPPATLLEVVRTGSAQAASNNIELKAASSEGRKHIHETVQQKCPDKTLPNEDTTFYTIENAAQLWNVICGNMENVGKLFR